MDNLIAKVEVVKLGPFHYDGLICEYAECQNWITESMKVLLVNTPLGLRLWCDEHEQDD